MGSPTLNSKNEVIQLSPKIVVVPISLADLELL